MREVKVWERTDEQIKCIGTSNSKVLSIRNLTNKIISGELNLYELNKSSDEIITKMLAIAINAHSINVSRIDIRPTFYILIILYIYKYGKSIR